MSALRDAPEVHVDDRATWRAWLDANHATASGAWLVTWRPRSGRIGLDYEAAVQEALCFGWVDSTGGRVDDERGKLYFAPRKPRSVWAADIGGGGADWPGLARTTSPSPISTRTGDA